MPAKKKPVVQREIAGEIWNEEGKDQTGCTYKSGYGQIEFSNGKGRLSRFVYARSSRDLEYASTPKERIRNFRSLTQAAQWLMDYARLPEFVTCESPDGWSLHAPGSTDEEIAHGEARPLVDGPWEEADGLRWIPSWAFMRAAEKLRK